MAYMCKEILFAGMYERSFLDAMSPESVGVVRLLLYKMEQFVQECEMRLEKGGDMADAVPLIGMLRALKEETKRVVDAVHSRNAAEN